MSVLVNATEVKTLQGNFLQVREQAMFAEPQESKGVFYFVADSLLRWEYTQPASLGIIANGKNIRLLRQNGQTQNSNAYALQAMVKMIMQTITGNLTADNGQFVVEKETGDNETLLTLTPAKRGNRQMFTRMQICLDKTGVIAKYVRMWEKSGDCTTIRFSNLQLNKPVPATLFQ